MEYLKFSCLYYPEELLWCHDLNISLIFKSFIHLEFIFVYGVNWCSSFILLHLAVQVSQHHSLKRLFLHHCMLLFPQSNINHKDMSLFLGSLFSSIDLCVCSYASTRLFLLQWTCSMVLYQVLWSLLLCSSFSILLRLSRVTYGSI